MAREADRAIDAWRAGAHRDVHRDMRAAVRASTLHSLFGPRLADDADFFGDRLQPLLDHVDRLPQAAELHRRLGTPSWRRARAARAEVDARIHAEIARARTRGPDQDPDVLSRLVHGRDADGAGLSDTEVRDQVVSLIAAGYETTSAAMAWAVHATAAVPGLWDRARDEAHEVLGGAPPDADTLPRLELLRAIVDETLRLFPPAVVSARSVAEDFTFHGRRIRAGTILLYSPYVTHRLGELWPRPLEFLPRRWDPADPLYRAPAPDTYLPFSAGPHRCVGAQMATTELTVMLTRLVQRTRLRLLVADPRPTGFASMRPRGGLPARITEVRAPATAHALA